MAEIQNGNEKADNIVLNTIERDMNSLFRLYLSASAKGVMARGIAASMIELENCVGVKPNKVVPK